MAQSQPDPTLGNQIKMLKSGSVSVALAGLGLGAVLMGVALALGVDWNTINWRAAMCVAGLFIFFGTALSLPSAIRRRNARMAIYEHGFVFDDGKAHLAMRWDEIT